MPNESKYSRYHRRHRATRNMASQAYHYKYLRQNRARTKKQYQQLVRILRAVQMVEGCYLCGWAGFPEGLDFHHINPKEKKFNIMKGYKSWPKLMDELVKCVVLCARCHRGVESGHMWVSLPGQEAA